MVIYSYPPKSSLCCLTGSTGSMTRPWASQDEVEAPTPVPQRYQTFRSFVPLLPERISHRFVWVYCVFRLIFHPCGEGIPKWIYDSTLLRGNAPSCALALHQRKEDRRELDRSWALRPEHCVQSRAKYETVGARTPDNWDSSQSTLRQQGSHRNDGRAVVAHEIWTFVGENPQVGVCMVVCVCLFVCLFVVFFCIFIFFLSLSFIYSGHCIA